MFRIKVHLILKKSVVHTGGMPSEFFNVDQICV